MINFSDIKNTWMNIFYEIYFAKPFKSKLHEVKGIYGGKNLPDKKIIYLNGRAVSVDRNPKKTFKNTVTKTA